ncbi:hypothetical protein ZWY2020_032821 [Hordeum vulgare]|nr:hypothetical protein ZWY2020_032821 [Hordeum vulgare]
MQLTEHYALQRRGERGENASRRYGERAATDTARRGASVRGEGAEEAPHALSHAPRTQLNRVDRHRPSARTNGRNEAVVRSTADVAGAEMKTAVGEPGSKEKEENGDKFRQGNHVLLLSCGVGDNCNNSYLVHDLS